jgi:3-methyladenine DNA glycosylase/8-oxoguanine DNA glycosylase
LILELEVPHNYDLIASVHSWIYPDIQPVPEQTGDTFLARIYEVDHLLVPLLIKQEQPGRRIRVDYPSMNVSEKKTRTILQEVLGLNVRMDGALRILRDEPLLSHITSKVTGIQPYLSPSIYEALAKTIIQQQISYRAANVITKKIVIKLSQKIAYNGMMFYSFPKPEAILNCGLDGLRVFGLGYKAQYIYEIVKLIYDGKLRTEDLKRKAFDEISAILKPIRGIGIWTIRTLAIAGLGDYSVFPCGDLGVRNLMGRLFKKDGKRMTPAEVECYTQHWGQNGPLVLYLLMCADVLGFLGKEGRQQTHKRSLH